MFASIFKSFSYDRSYNYRNTSGNPYGAYGTGRSHQRRSTRGGASGAIELHSRDDGNDQNALSADISSGMSSRREGIREFILDPK